MKNIAAAAMLLIPVAMSCSWGCAPTETPPPIPIEKTAVVNGPGPVAKIDEIVLERFGHRDRAPFYKVVLRKDGTVTYTGEFNVTKI